MRLVVLIFIITFFTLQLNAQYSIVSKSLEKQISESSEEVFRINLYLSDRVDINALHLEFKLKNTPLSDRSKQTIQALQTKAAITQDPILVFLEQWQKENKSLQLNIKQYWISNVIVLNANLELISLLDRRQDIDWIEWDETLNISFDPPRKGETVSNAKSIGGIEPGLAAIKAPFMWKLGYTGKNTRAFSVDTGIWEEHPAITDNFLSKYFPYSQTWFSFDEPFPADKINSHGTHTMGTVLGLEKATNDTIGVAFNARFIATDPIVSNIAFIKPLSEILTAFEWALNPDGDLNNTDDIPHVINNSWGISSSFDPDLCSQNYVQDIFSACSAANIAVVFSAGNNGPGSETLSRPQYVVVNDVVPFTVGALDGNVPNFPIAGFSSRGPTQCDVDPELKFKPEVSAPGVNVRSAVGKNGYESYDGTSMAGPHVSGAFLLLREAFPEVEAEDVLRALFYTADDLGDEGEDNDYGMGIINLESAFNFLAESYMPSIPATEGYDLELFAVTNVGSDLPFVCGDLAVIKVLIKNNGTIAVENLIAKLFNNEVLIAEQLIEQILLPNDTVELVFSVGLNAIYNELQAVVSAIETIEELDRVNNHRMLRISKLKQATIPFFEDFETHDIVNSDWFIINEDYAQTWDTLRTYGIPYSKYSARMNFRNYNPRNFQRDDLITPFFDFNDLSNDSLFLKFTYAYRFIHQLFNDSMYVYLTNQCLDESYVIWSRGNQQFSTADTLMNPFIPQNSSHWKEVKINLSQFIHENSINISDEMMIRFTTVNRGGSAVYLDNVALFRGDNDPTTVQEKIINYDLKLYPNPNKSNTAFIEVSNYNQESIQVEVFDMLGKKMPLQYQNIKQQIIELSIHDFSAGIYFIKISSKDKMAL
jgi:subtilisin family serine protease